MSHLHHKISALIDGELHGSARRRAITHVRRCADCRHELKATLALKSRVSGLAAAAPSDDLVLVLSGVSTDSCSPRPALGASLEAARSRLRPVVRRIVVGAGSMSVAVLSVAYVVGGPAHVPVTRVSPPVDEYTADFAGTTGLAPLSDPAVGALDGNVQPAALGVSDGAATGAPSVSTGTVSDDGRAVAELRRAMDAPNRYAYEGTRQIRTYDTTIPAVITVDVEHAPGQGTSFDVTTGRPDATATFIAQRDAGVAGGLDGAPLTLLVDAYDVTVAGSGSVLGRPVTVIAASRGGVVDARFWIDDATGLLLRREMYDGGVLVRSTGFTALRVDRNGFLTHLPPELEAPQLTELSMSSVAALNDEGWTCPSRLPGDFALTGLQHVDTNGDVVHASYSDGLSTVSLFEQRGSLDPAAVADLATTSVGGDAYVAYGLPTVVIWQSGDMVYTAVTDASQGAVDGVVAGLPHLPRQSPAPSAGVSDRLVTGLRRMGSFLSPAQ